MTPAEQALAVVQASVRARNAAEPAGCDHECVAICAGPFGVDVDFWGPSLGESYAELAQALGTPEVAACVRTITLRGPDEGANGTKNWDLTALLTEGVTFTKLEAVTIEQNSPGDHNRSIVAETYDEDGCLARLLAAAPNLRVLVSPSAPSAEFFQVGARPIRHLSVDAGYAHQDFLLNLSRSSCFPELYSLEWGEYDETYMEDFAARVTPADHYRELLSSTALPRLSAVELRNPMLTRAELLSLRRLRDRRFQLKVVRHSSEWVDLEPEPR